MPLAAFPKCFLQALCVTGEMTLDAWIDLSAGFDLDGLEFTGPSRPGKPRELERIRRCVEDQGRLTLADAIKLRRQGICWWSNLGLTSAARAVRHGVTLIPRTTTQFLSFPGSPRNATFLELLDTGPPNFGVNSTPPTQ